MAVKRGPCLLTRHYILCHSRLQVLCIRIHLVLLSGYTYPALGRDVMGQTCSLLDFRLH